MTNQIKEIVTPKNALAAGKRQLWSVPRLRCHDAKDAQFGSPVFAEGIFAFGS